MHTSMYIKAFNVTRLLEHKMWYWYFFSFPTILVPVMHHQIVHRLHVVIFSQWAEMALKCARSVCKQLAVSRCFHPILLTSLPSTCPLDKQNCQPLRLSIISLCFLRKCQKICLTTALHFWTGWVPSSPNLQNPRSFSSFPFEMLVMIRCAWLSESVPDDVQTAHVGLTDLALLPP